MQTSVNVIEERFSKIKTPEDFISSPEGLTLLDAISMRLQAIGENIKKIGQINASLLEFHPEIE